MKAEEFVQYIDLAQALTGRGIDDHDALAWRTVVGDLPYSLAVDAIEREVRSSDKYVSPSSVRLAAKSIARDRLASSGDEDVPPSGLDSTEYLAWTRARRMAVVAGQDGQTATRVAMAAIGHVANEEARTLPVPDLDLLDAARIIEHDNDGT